MPRPRAVLTPAETDYCRHAAEAAFRNPFGEGFRTAMAGVREHDRGHVDALDRRGLASLDKYIGA